MEHRSLHLCGIRIEVAAFRLSSVFHFHAFSPRLLLCAHPITGSGSKFSKVTGKLYFKTLLQLKLRILLSQSFNKLNLKYYFGGLLTGPIIDC